MEVARNDPRSDNIEENPFLWIIYRTSVPQILISSLHTVVRYCADQLPKRMTLGYLRVVSALLVIIMPRSLTYVLLYPIFRLAFGNLYPAYASYKAVRTKNVKEYVKWMMYWIVFALFTCAETFTDVFFSFWFPFYYEIKAILVIWLLSPATKGSSILYRRFVHPTLIRREAEIDEALTRATEQGYVAVLHLGSKGVNYATTVLMQTAIKGGGGLVQHLKKSYSLSDLTGEKEDENRNTSHMHDETDTEVEPRRREHVGRRGYSPRRTQSSSNRVEMYFSEVDVDVRQPRSREPTTSLTNIRSSDDISSGYSSGEALQTSRTSQGDSLVRTSSVGARTRAKPRSTTKKTPEDSGEDSDSNNPSSSKNISLPTPLSHVTPEQALEILLLLSQNSNISDYIKFDRGSFVAGNDDLLKNTSQSGSNLEKTEPEESNGKPSDSVLTAEVQIIQSIETKVAPERSSTVEQANTAGPANNVTEPQQPEIQTSESKETVSRDVKITEKITNDVVSSKESSKHASRTITDELCQNKFDELKQLLNNAHKAVNNIVYTQEIPRYSDASTSETSPQDNSSQNTDVERADERENNQTGKYASEDVKILSEESQASKHTMADDAVANVVAENENATFMEIWSNPNESRNSNSLDRAGKYNKKPAPKVPFTKSEENLNEADAQSALKATLVIKTGTLKTFSNVNVTKDVFIAHPADAKVKGKKSKRQRTKQSFSKLLTIPKNIFHNAFYREHKGARKVEDSSSSDISTSETRSNSIEPQEMIIELAPKLSSSDQEINVSNDDKSENDTSNSSDSYVLALDDGEEGANKIKKVENEENVEIDKNEKVLQASEETRIRDMSQPLRAGQKLESDIF